MPATGLVVLITVAVSSGCYQFVPVEGSSVPLPADVRLKVERSESGSAGGEGDGYVEGQLLSWDADQAVLLWHGNPEPVPFVARREEVLHIRRTEIETIELRRINAGKTGLLLAGAAALAALTVWTLFEVEGGGDTPSPSPPGDATIVPTGSLIR